MEKSHHNIRKLGLLGILLFTFISLRAQDRYMVFFSDKDTVTYTYQNPEAYLSPKAVARRERFGIPLEFTDLPVDSTYVRQLEAQGVDVIYTSRWFNGALVACSDLSVISSVDFITDYELVKPVTDSNSEKSGENGASVNKHFNFKKKKKGEALLNVLQNEMLGIDQMHDVGYNGQGITVAVFDGGFRGVDTSPYFEHLFENDQYLPGYDFVGNSPDVFKYGQHGTEALSCIAGYLPGVLEAGAYGADVMLCITEEGSSEFKIEEYNWLFAAERADSVGVDIISTSLGYTTFDDPEMNYRFKDLDGETAVITKAVVMATEKGMACVVSAGNEGSGSWKYISPPADAPDILAVGAVNSRGDRVSFSSFGPTADGRIKPDVAALGLQTVVADAQGNITTSNGTSFSAPLIAGLTAGVWQAYPELNNLEIIEKIKDAGNQVIVPDNELGYGIPNFTRVQDVVTAGRHSALPKARQPHYFSVFPNPVEQGKIFIESPSGSFTGSIDLLLYNSTGQLVMQKHVAHFRDGAISIDTQVMDKGIYILKVLSPDLSDTFKLVKF